MQVQRPILINSIPKSGTYFVGSLLQGAGVAATQYHLRSAQFWKWPAGDALDDVIRTPDAFRHAAPLSQTVRYITPGFTYGHLDHTPEAQALLSGVPDLAHVVLIRDLRDCLVSATRFRNQRLLALGTPNTASDADQFAAFMRTGSAGFLDGAARQSGWLATPGINVFRFEDLVSHPDPDHRAHTARHLLAACGVTLADPRALVDRALDTRTRTRSGRTSDWRALWTDAAQDLFDRAGGTPLNAALGYGDAAPKDRARPATSSQQG